MYRVHEYPYDGYGSHVALNAKSTQLHVHTVEKVVKDDESDWVSDVIAYNLENLERVEPRDVVPEPEFQSRRDTGRLVDLSHLGDKKTRYLAIALHPSSAKLLARKFVGEDIFDAKVSSVIMDRHTGEELLAEIAQPAKCGLERGYLLSVRRFIPQIKRSPPPHPPEPPTQSPA